MEYEEFDYNDEDEDYYFMDNNSSEECYCEVCSDQKTFEAINEVAKRVSESKEYSDIHELLFDLSEFSRLIGMKEVLFSNKIALENLGDDKLFFDELKDLGEKDSDYEINNKINDNKFTEREKTDTDKNYGYWNTPFNNNNKDMR